jgi:hypothetical protein
MESVEREVRWLNELIESERVGRDVKGSASEGAPQGVSEGSSLGASEGSAQQNSTSGETGGLPRHRDQSRPDPSDDTTT